MSATPSGSAGGWPPPANKREHAWQAPAGREPAAPMVHTVELWLRQRYPAPAGAATARLYRKLLLSLRAYVQAHGCDLDSAAPQLTPLIHTWASVRTPTSPRQGGVAPATYNQRLAALRSFYAWVRQQQPEGWPDPTEPLSRSASRKYSGAHALDVQQVRAQLQEIDRSTPRGQRDYVLLQVALNTGRSARELASLSWGDVDVQRESLMLTFAGGRKGKVMHDMLDSRLARVLLEYLHTIYGQELHVLSPQAPLWVSFSDRTSRQAIGPQTIADICATHLGVSQLQRLRHTFALTMDQVGASVETIQSRLGHEQRATTDVYLANLKRAQNPHAGRLAEAFGL